MDKYNFESNIDNHMGILCNENKFCFCGDLHNNVCGDVVIGTRVSLRKMFPAHVSLGMRVSPHTYH